MEDLCFKIWGTSFANTQLFFDMAHQNIINLGVAWHRLLFSVDGIQINIMAGTMPQQGTSLALQELDKSLSFHKAISFVSCCSGTSSMAIIK